MDFLAVKFKLTLLLLLCLITKPAVSLKYKGRKDYKINTSFISHKISATSQVQCLLFCTMNGTCVSASYNSQNTCLLSTHDTTSDNGDSPGIPDELESAEGWTVFSRARFPVFHALGSYSKYTMTFTQAEDLCRGYGTTVATRSGLLEARTLGFEQCICGWLSDASMGFVMQSHHTSCGSTYNEEIIPCYREYANAWCKVK